MEPAQPHQHDAKKAGMMRAVASVVPKRKKAEGETMWIQETGRDKSDRSHPAS
jgi:hypothetical protein